MAAVIESTVAGIPCKVEVTHFHKQAPMGPQADSDLDCYGYTEIEFDVLDRRGRPAPWLERKLSDADTERIREQIAECYA